jgi:hypothetical protein
MKKNFILLFVIAFACLQCTKEGPAGPKGATGLTGADGNANVITYLITDSTLLAWDFNNVIALQYDSTFNIPDSIKNEGVVLVYLKFEMASNYWYPCPGLGVDGYFQTRLAIGNTSIRIQIFNADGSFYTGTPPEVSAVRIIQIPASTVIAMGKNSQCPEFQDYKAVMRFFNLE